MILPILAGFASGIISGMGIGGGAILIPALFLISDITQKTAQGINLVYFIPTAVCALIIHLKNKRVEIKSSLIIGFFGILGTLPGFFLANYLSDGFLRKIFGIFLALIGFYEIFILLKVEFSKNKSTKP